MDSHGQGNILALDNIEKDGAEKDGGKRDASSQAVGLVSLGCPKALVDSEQIATELLDLGYEVAVGDESDIVVVNTCGFIDAAKQESRDTIAGLLDEGKRVVVTGCMGNDPDLKTEFPNLEFLSGPADVAPVVKAVQHYLPGAQKSDAVKPHVDYFTGELRARLTDDHFAYLKISEGCNHKCSFCILPHMRGKLRSRTLDDVIAEGEALAEDGVQEISLIAQDLSAYGADLRYPQIDIDGESYTTNLMSICRILGAKVPWLRLHYVYPYPNVDQLIPLMNEGLVLPYLDIPLQHASHKVLKAMRRPAAAEKSLERIQRWREICPEIAIRSTFIVGFPGETDEDIGHLLDFLEEAQLDRVGCFTYSAVEGARANTLPDPVEEAEKLDRQERVYEIQAEISAQRLARHVGSTLRVMIDSNDEGLVGRSMFDAPEIDGSVFIADGDAKPGDFVWVDVESSDDHDLYGRLVGEEIRLSE